MFLFSTGTRTAALLLTVCLGLPFSAAGNDREVTLRGRVVCFNDAGRPETDCSGPAGFGLRSDSGTIYRFRSGDPGTGMFSDPRVRERELEVRAWIREDGEYEVVKIHSLRQGRRYDIHYFCEVCTITSLTPGPCWCCQQEFEFCELPAPDP